MALVTAAEPVRVGCDREYSFVGGRWKKLDQGRVDLATKWVITKCQLRQWNRYRRLLPLALALAQRAFAIAESLARAARLNFLRLESRWLLSRTIVRRLVLVRFPAMRDEAATNAPAHRGHHPPMVPPKEANQPFHRFTCRSPMAGG